MALLGSKPKVGLGHEQRTSLKAGDRRSMTQGWPYLVRDHMLCRLHGLRGGAGASDPPSALRYLNPYQAWQNAGLDWFVAGSLPDAPTEASEYARAHLYPAPHMGLSEIPGAHDSVADLGDSAEEEGAGDRTNGWIPDHVVSSIVRWAHDDLAATEQDPGQHTEEVP
jgi:hypothetical protein